MLAIQPVRLPTCDKELTSIGIRTGIGARQLSRFRVFVNKVLIGKRGSINAELSCSVMIQEIASLDHKIFHDTMKGGTFVSRRLLILQKLTGT